MGSTATAGSVSTVSRMIFSPSPQDQLLHIFQDPNQRAPSVWTEPVKPLDCSVPCPKGLSATWNVTIPDWNEE